MFLVHRHLLMSHTAFRRDPNDENVLVPFAQEVMTPEVLRMLLILTAADIGRQATLELSDTAHLPAAQKLSAQAAVLKERQFIQETGHENMLGVELRWSPQVVRVVGVRDDVALIRAIIRALAQGVSHTKQQTLRKAPVPADLERIVARASDVVGLPD